MKETSPEKMLKESKAYDILYKLITVVNESIDVNEVLDAALDNAMALFGAEYAGIYVTEKNKLVVKAHRNVSEELAVELSSIDVNEDVKEIRTGSEKLSDKPGRISNKAKKLGIQSFMSMPIKFRDKLVGLLILGSKKYGDFSQEDVKTASIISGPVGLAIENANLHRKIRGIDQYTFALMNSIHAAVMTIQEHTVLWCNPMTLEMFGYSPGELTGKSTEVLVKDAGMYKTIRRNIDYAIETKGSFCFEFEALKKDGKPFKAECCISLVRQEGSEPYIVVAVVRDISREKGLEARVKEFESKKRGGF